MVARMRMRARRMAASFVRVRARRWRAQAWRAGSSARGIFRNGKNHNIMCLVLLAWRKRARRLLAYLSLYNKAKIKAGLEGDGGSRWGFHIEQHQGRQAWCGDGVAGLP